MAEYKQLFDADNNEINPGRSQSAETSINATHADVAGKLETARKINGLPFDGTGDIVLGPHNIDTYSKGEIDEKLNHREVLSEVPIGYGLTCTLTKIGRVVALSCRSNQTSNRPDGWYDLAEKIPEGWRPQHTVILHAKVNIGGTSEVNRQLTQIFEWDGYMGFLSGNMGAAPLTVNMYGIWLC